MVLVHNKYKNTLVGVLRTQIAFVTHSSPSCYVALCTQVIRLNSGNLGPQKIDSGVFIIIPALPPRLFGGLWRDTTSCRLSTVQRSNRPSSTRCDSLHSHCISASEQLAICQSQYNTIKKSI